MKEQKAIVEAFRKTDHTVRKVALATVVRVRGSSYRSPGARMLITDDGKWTGSISGGCLEGDALRKARKVMQDQEPQLVTYDTSEDSNQNLGIGLGCNGIIDVLLEPVNETRPHDPIKLFDKIIGVHEPVGLATVFFKLALPGREVPHQQKPGNIDIFFKRAAEFPCHAGRCQSF